MIRAKIAPMVPMRLHAVSDNSKSIDYQKFLEYLKSSLCVTISLYLSENSPFISLCIFKYSVDSLPVLVSQYISFTSCCLYGSLPYILPVNFTCNLFDEIFFCFL